MRALFYVIICLLMMDGILRAEDKVLLIPEEKGEDLIVIKADEVIAKDGESEVVEDEELKELDSKFKLPEFMVLEVRGSATIMAMKVQGAIGFQAFGGVIEVGVDAAAMAVFAGKSGGFVPEVGAYAKLRLIPLKDGKKVYVKGRYYYAFGINEDFRNPTMEYGIGLEKKDGFFIELTVQHWVDEEDNDEFFMPFISFGMVLGGKKKTEEKRLFEDEISQEDEEK